MLTRVGGAKPTPDTLARTDPAHADALVPLLCGLGADVDAPTALDASPLHAAARLHDAKALVYALVACGAPIREVDPARPFVLTPVELAAKCANVSVLQALLLAGGRPTRRAEALADGYTSLTFLERRKAAACVQILKTFSA